MKRKLTFLTLIALAVVLAAACGRRHKHHGELTDAQLERRAHDKLDYGLDEIDATDAQRAKIGGILDKQVLPELKALRPLKKETHDIAVRELLSGKPDAGTLHKLVDDRAVTLTGLAHKLADAAIDAHAVLTPAQRTDIADRMQERAAEHDDSDGEWMANMMVERALDKLDASNQQEELVLDHKERLTTEFKALRTSGDRSRATMDAELRSKAPDAAVIHKLIDVRAGQYAGVAHKVVDGAVEIGATLTPKQREIICEKIGATK